MKKKLQETTYTLPSLPFSIALLADLHERPYTFLSQVAAHHPDMIAVVGDMLYGRMPESEELVAKRITPFLSACVDIAPTFVSLGNHEYMLCDEDIALLSSTGATILDNNWVQWNGVFIGGLTSAAVTEYRAYRSALYANERVFTCHYPKYEKRGYYSSDHKPVPEVGWLDKFCAQKGTKILLCHEPQYWPLYLSNRDIQLCCSGHAHGGQWRYYSLLSHRWKGLYAPSEGWFPKYTEGVIDGKLVISRGLSNTAPFPIFRFFNPRELVFIEGY